MVPFSPRNFFALIVVVVAALASPVRAAETNATRPNILWVVTEDHATTYVGAYGNPIARTPVFDRLAKGGILFTHAYAPAPVCAPCRASMITGMFAPSLGTQHMRSNVPMPSWMRYFPAYLRDAGYFTSNNAKTDYNAAVLPGTWDENGGTAHWRHRKAGQPFFSVFNFNASHEQFLHKRLPLKTDPTKVRVPAYLPDTPEVRADIAQYYDRVSEADRLVGEILAQLEADDLAEDTIVFYYSDHGGVLPRSKRFLYESGTHPALAMHFPKKWAALAPSPAGSTNDELVNFVDFAPTLLSLAGVKAPDYFQGRAIAGPARVPAPPYTYNFRDRMDEAYDLCRAVTDGRWRYIRNYRPELPNLQHVTYLWNMPSMQEWDRLHRAGKLDAVQESFFQAKPVEQLFDTEADPDNVHNLAGDPKHRDVLLRFRTANRAHLLATRDTGFMPEAMLRELSGSRSPSEVARNDAIYPLARILDWVDRLQLAPSLAVQDLATGTKDAIPMIRYWTAQASQAAGTKSDLTPLLHDANVSVRLAAAFAAGKRGQATTAQEIFAQVLSAPGSSRETKLEALNYMTNLPKPAASFRPLLEAASKSDRQEDDYVIRAAQYLLTQGLAP